MRVARPLALGAAALAATAMATPAFAATTTPTSLTLKASHASVAPKHHDGFTATLKAGNKLLDGQKVSLYEKKPGAKTWTLVGSKSTVKGKVSFSVVPAGTKKGQKDEFEVKYAGTKTAPKYGASHSHIVNVTLS